MTAALLQADPNKIKSYYVDLAPGSSIDLGNANGYPRISARAPGNSVTVAQVGPALPTAQPYLLKWSIYGKVCLTTSHTNNLQCCAHAVDCRS